MTWGEKRRGEERVEKGLNLELWKAENLLE